MLQLKSLSEQIEQAIKDEILSGKLAPGERITPDELAARWGVSTTPVRDALKRLETLGFVHVASRRGVFVAEMDLREFKNIYELRIALECQALASAITRIPDTALADAVATYERAAQHFEAHDDVAMLIEHDHWVHNLIIQYCDNDKLVEIMEGLSDLSLWARKTIVERRRQSYIEALPEHLRVLKALQARDVDAAQTALRAHLTNAYDRAMVGLG